MALLLPGNDQQRSRLICSAFHPLAMVGSVDILHAISVYHAGPHVRSLLHHALVSYLEPLAIGVSLVHRKLSMHIFVGNLEFSATEQDVRQLFEQYGVVDTVRIMTDRETGRPRGFGFVEMPDDTACLLYTSPSPRDS